MAEPPAIFSLPPAITQSQRFPNHPPIAQFDDSTRLFFHQAIQALLSSILFHSPHPITTILLHCETKLPLHTINPLSTSKLDHQVFTLIHENHVSKSPLPKNRDRKDIVWSFEISGFVSIRVFSPIVTLIIQIIKKVDNKNHNR
jgi:hypothetical protein